MKKTINNLYILVSIMIFISIEIEPLLWEPVVEGLVVAGLYALAVRGTMPVPKDLEKERNRK